MSLRLGATAALGGVLYFLGYLGVGIWPLLFVFLVPLWTALDGVASAGGAAACGLAFGAAAFAGGFTWLWPLVDSFLGGNRLLGLALWLGWGVWFAAQFALYAVVVRMLRRRGAGVLVAGVAPLVALEWLQPQLFPLYAGAGLATVPVLVQTADLGGPLLLTALVAAANAVAFASWRWWRREQAAPRGAWLATAAATAAVLAYAGVRMAAVDAAARQAPALSVGIVQANVGVLEKRVQKLVTHRRHLEQTHELLAAGPVDLVVWPETAYARALRRPLPISGRPVVGNIDVPLLFGSSSVREEGGHRVSANSAMLVGADGMIRQVYDKNLLIPLTEYLPLAGAVPALAQWLPDVQAFEAARETPPLALGPWRFVTPICYEAIRPDFVRRMVRRGHPHLLVTLANDAWFGDSQEPWLHLALARLRAVEHRRFLVRATNSGVSAIVDPAGRILARTGVLERTNLRGRVHLLEADTPYARFGDWPGAAAAAVVALALVVRPRRGAAG